MSSDILSKHEVATISISRLEYLEELERNLPILIENALKENKANALKRLHQMDKENPAVVSLRVKRYVEKNRDKINERRRERRKIKNAVDAPTQPTTVEPSISSSGSEHSNQTRTLLETSESVPPPCIKRYVPEGGVSILFLN